MSSKKTWSKEKVARGSRAEEMALELLNGAGWRAEQKVDIYHHIDLFYIDSFGDTLGVDVKSIKLENDHQFFVELKNSFGLAGWLYGRSDQIWFERFESFLIHDTEVLRQMIKHKQINPQPTSQPTVWRYYRREIKHDFGTRYDLSVVVPLTDLMLFGEEIQKTPDQIRKTLEFYQRQKEQRAWKMNFSGHSSQARS